MYLPVFFNSPEILSQALSCMFRLRYSSLDLFQRHGYIPTSSINCSRDITQNIHNTQLNSIKRISELTQQTTNYILPAARDCMGSTAHARPQQRFKNIATNQTTRRRSYIANIAT